MRHYLIGLKRKQVWLSWRYCSSAVSTRQLFFAGEVRVFHPLNTFTSVYDRENDCSNKSTFNKNLLCRPSVRRPSEKLEIACCAALWCHLLLCCAKISNEWLVCNCAQSRLVLFVVKLSDCLFFQLTFWGQLHWPALLLIYLVSVLTRAKMVCHSLSEPMIALSNI